MARIISFQQYRQAWVVLSDSYSPINGNRYCMTYTPLDGFVSINLETVRKLSSRQADYPHKQVKSDRSFLSRLFKGEYDIVDDESKSYYWLTFEYKNHRQDNENYLIDKEEYERLKPELAKYGWTI